MRTLLLFFLVVGLAGCSLAGSDQAPVVRLTNNTDVPILYVAIEREASHRLDISPELPRTEFTGRIVKPGATTNVEQIEGGWERGDDLRFFLYATPESADAATYAKSQDVSAEALRRQDYLVRVDSL